MKQVANKNAWLARFSYQQPLPDTRTSTNGRLMLNFDFLSLNNDIVKIPVGLQVPILGFTATGGILFLFRPAAWVLYSNTAIIFFSTLLRARVERITTWTKRCDLQSPRSRLQIFWTGTMSHSRITTTSLLGLSTRDILIRLLRRICRCQHTFKPLYQASINLVATKPTTPRRFPQHFPHYA